MDHDPLARSNCAPNTRRSTTTALLIGAGAMQPLRDQLASLGYQVLAAPAAEAAVQAARVHEPDVVFMQVDGPWMSGLCALREAGCRAPVIAVSARGTERIEVGALGLGVRGWLCYAPDDAALREQIDEALSERRLAAERENMDETVLLAEAVQTTAVTLSHYLNNYLTALNGALQLAAELLRPGRANPELLQLLDESRRSSANIEAVTRVLLQLSRAELAPYSGTTRILDIETAVQHELEGLRPPRLK